MKRIVCLIIALALTCAALTGCSGSSLVFTTGGSDGVYYNYGDAIAGIVSKNSDAAFDVRTSGGSKSNILALSAGSADIGIVSGSVAAYAFEGRELFAGEGIVDGFAAMASLYPEAVHIVAATGIDDISELAGKRVSVGAVDSAAQVDARHILSAYGMDFGDIEVKYMSDSEAAAALAAKQLDAFFATASVPCPTVATLSSDTSFRLLSVDAEAAAKLAADYPYYTAYTIPSGSYNGVRGDTATVCVRQLLVCRTELSNDTAYSIVKALYENPASIAMLHVKGEQLDLAAATQGIAIPLHAGAQRYYSEAGVG